MRDLSGDRKGYLLFFILKGGGSLLRATNTKYESEKSIKKSDVRMYVRSKEEWWREILQTLSTDI